MGAGVGAYTGMLWVWAYRGAVGSVCAGGKGFLLVYFYLFLSFYWSQSTLFDIKNVSSM